MPYSEIGSLSRREVPKRFKKIGAGACRQVFDYTPETVLKMDHERFIGGPDPYRYNRQEAEFWEAIKDTRAARFFFGVLAYSPSNGLLVMERALKMPEEYDEMVKAEGFDALNEICGIIGLYDNGAGNCGYKPDGSIALLDYGFQSVPHVQQIRDMVKAAT